MKPLLLIFRFLARCLIGALAGGICGAFGGFLWLIWLNTTGRLSGDQSVGMIAVPMILGYVGVIFGAAVGFALGITNVLSVITKKTKS